jgi:hypothetical protein
MPPKGHAGSAGVAVRSARTSSSRQRKRSLSRRTSAEAGGAAGKARNPFVRQRKRGRSPLALNVGAASGA